MNKDERAKLIESARQSVQNGGTRDIAKASAKANIVIADALTEIIAILLKEKP